MIRPKPRSTCTDPEAIAVLACFREADHVGLGLDWFERFLQLLSGDNSAIECAEHACKDLNV